MHKLIVRWAHFDHAHICATASAISMAPDDMIAIMLDRSCDQGGDGLVHDLLGEFRRGYPIENLRRLLVSDILGDAQFLIDELDQELRPILHDVVTLLEHDDPAIRYTAVGALCRCTTWEDGWALARVVRTLGDLHHAVWQRTCRELGEMEWSQLRAGLEYIYQTEPNSIYATFRNIFLSIWFSPNHAKANTIDKLLKSSDPIARRFGAAMALRPRLFIDPSYVGLARSVQDPELAAWVRDASEQLTGNWILREPPQSDGPTGTPTSPEDAAARQTAPTLRQQPAAD